MLKKTFSLLLFIGLFVCCSKKEDIPPNSNNVELETISSQVLNEGGVILTGNITGVELPLNYGFVLSSYEGGTFDETYNFESLNGFHNGRFNIELRNNLEKDQTYYYNAVAYTSNKYIFGEEKSFVSNGSAAPFIKEVVPNIAHVSDTITITGKYFSKNFNVFFDGVQSNIIVKSDSLIKCIVPTNFSIGEANRSIKIKKSTQEETVYDDFSLYTPEVYSLEPAIAHDSDTITIVGNHFDNVKLRNRLTLDVYGNDSNLEIIESSRTEIKFINAGTYYDFHPKFKLTSQFQTIDITEKLEVKLPTINDAPNCISYGEAITISGMDFPSYNSGEFDIKLGETSFAIKSINRSQIILDVHDGFYNDFDLKDITVNYLGNEIIYETNICVDEPWIKVSFENPSITYSYQDNAYAVLETVGKFNSNKYEFESITGEQVPEEVNYGHLRVFNADKFYHYNSGINPKAFKSYDIFTNKLTDLAPFPGENRDSGFIIGVGDYIYFGLGGLNAGGKYFSDIWRYSIQNNMWEFIIDFPGISSYDTAKLSPMVFAIGDKIFIAAGERTTYNSDLWELDTQSNALSVKAPLPIPIVDVNKATVIDDKAYFESNNLFEYNSTNNTWKTYSDIKGIGFKYSGYSQSIFTHEGIIYRSINTSSPYYNLLYKLNPKYLD